MSPSPAAAVRLARLHIHPIGGVAGDMLLGALIGLGADPAPIVAAIDSLGVEGLRLQAAPVEVDGEAAWSVRSIATAPEPAHRHRHEIEALIARAEAPEAARQRARRIFEVLIAAEAAVHGGDAASVHLHEVGQLDSILDVLGIAVALHGLGDPPITCSPLPVGHGSVQTAHGLLDCPVPAVRQIAEHHAVPLVQVPLEGETVTPTGIAVVAQAAHRFCEPPSEAPAAQGAGAGTRRFPGRPNVVRVYGYGKAG